MINLGSGKSTLVKSRCSSNSQMYQSVEKHPSKIARSSRSPSFRTSMVNTKNLEYIIPRLYAVNRAFLDDQRSQFVVQRCSNVFIDIALARPSQDRGLR